MDNYLKPPPRTNLTASRPSSASNPAPNRGLFPAPNSIQRASNSTTAGGRRKGKVALQPGHSALDWARLKNSGQNLRGVEDPGLIKVSRDELAKHKTMDDAWTVLQGKVYNITPYINFHPGGADEIMKCAGKDGTKLFMFYHSWVNHEHMLDKCLVGMYMP